MRPSSLSLTCAVSFLLPLLAFSDEPAPASVLLTPYHTEQEWIISSICRNAFELLAYAKDKKGELVLPSQVALKELTDNPLTYDVIVKGAQVSAEATLQWPDSIWSPKAYLPFCQAVAHALKFSPTAATTTQGNPLHTLLDFSETAIEAENHRVSQWLTTEPANAAAHEQAALILGTLAMKENSGYFWDPRDICNHVCTHLAVAQFLRGGSPLSVEGQLANCMVGLIVDTKTQTGHNLDQIAAEKNPPADLAAWLNASRMRNTRDWRLVKNPESATPFEQVEYIRALAEAVDADQSMGWLQAHSMPNRPDWERVILEMNFSVDAGHVFAQNSIAMELHTMQATFPGSFEKDTLVSDLNQLSGDVLNFDGADSSVTVINRGMWAQFFQRHLCHAIIETGNFFANKWGVPENTRALDNVVETNFSSLTLYPFLQLAELQTRHVTESPGASVALFTAHPELAPDFLVWFKSSPDPDILRLRQAVTDWFKPPVVHGTAYGAMSRAPVAGWDKAQVDQLYAIAPLQIQVAGMELSSHYGAKFTLSQVKDVMGPLLDYDVRAIELALNATDLTFDQHVEAVEKAAGINSDYYYVLGSLYLDNHQEDKAAAAYQEWVNNATDRVKVSNNVGWLVNYYYDHGHQDKAMALAQEAAEVYSYQGLETMMDLQDRMGHPDDAESYGQKIQERYDDFGPLARFYQLHAAKGDTRFQTKFDDMAQTVFPLGMKKVTLASFTGPPDSGMNFAETNDAMQKNGLSSNQVVVALDGYAVMSEKQYSFIRCLSDSPTMHLIVWDGQAYREITANQPGRKFGVPMQDYHP